MLKTLATKCLDIILPPKCISCGTFVDDANTICPSCWGDLNFISEPSCKICGYPFQFKAEGIELCAGCLNERPLFEKAKSVWVYDQHSKHMVTSFKYSDKTHTADIFGALMSNTGASFIESSDFVVPVPLHPLKLFQRRYNQAALLAQSIARKNNIPIIPDLLIRTKNSPPQASLNRKQRLENIKSAFDINPKFKAALKDKTITLVDDVMTTGATINECAKILLNGGAYAVYVITLARIVEK